MSLFSRLLSWLLSAPVLAYRYLLSPLIPPRCRYQPSCSEYALEALRRHGPARGSSLALKRLLRCHPWSGYGYDPVPPSDRELVNGGNKKHGCGCGNKALKDNFVSPPAPL